MATNIIIPFIGKDIRKRLEGFGTRGILRSSENISSHSNLKEWDNMSSSGDFRKSVSFVNSSSTKLSASSSLHGSASKTKNTCLASRVIFRLIGKLLEKDIF